MGAESSSPSRPKNLGAEAPAGQPARVEKGAVDARSSVGGAEHFVEQSAVAVVAGDGEPLHLVLVSIGDEAQQLGHTAVDVAEGVRIVALPLERELIAGCAPACGTAIVARAVEDQDGGFLERGRIIGGRGVRRVVFHQDHARVGETLAHVEVRAGALGNGPHQRHGIDLIGPGSGE